MGPTDSGPYRVGPNHWTALRQTAQNFALFFSLSRFQFRSFFLSLGGLFLSFFLPLGGRIVSSFLSLGVFSCSFVSHRGSFRGICWCLRRRGPSNVHVWALGLSCETPAACSRCPLFSGFGPTVRGSTPNRAKIGRA